MQDAVARARQTPNVEIIWASTREVFNVVEAGDIGVPYHHGARRYPEKLPDLGTKSAAELSLGAVRAFRADAVAVGLKLKLDPYADAAE